MFDLPMHPVMFAAQSEAGMPAANQLYAEVFNAADLDVGYEVAFPFLTAAEDACVPPVQAPVPASANS